MATATKKQSSKRTAQQPQQFDETVRKNGVEARVVCSDFRDINRSSLDNKVDLLFADPPFNIGHGYVGFDDNQEEAEFHKMLDTLVWRSSEWLRPGGRLCVHVPDELVYVIQHAALHNELEPDEWIIWHFRFGQCGKTRFINSKCHLLTFIKSGGLLTWNPDAVMVDSDRASTYDDPRTKESSTPGKRVPLDVWGIPSDGPNWGRIQGNNDERRSVKKGAPLDHPNQLPEVYLERIIRAWSNPGDLIVDCVAGSGTTSVVAQALKRHSLSIDISRPNCESIVDRLNKGSVRVKS